MKNDLLPTPELFACNEVELHFKRPLFDSMYHIAHADDVVNLIKKFPSYMKLDVKEYFWLISLTNANKVLSASEINIGTLDTTVINIREIFQTALLTHAKAIILVHNHPSGNVNPSMADKDITKKMKQAAEYLELTILDHIIITKDAYFSFADEGVL